MTGIVTWKRVLPANAVHAEGAAVVMDCCWCCSLVVHRHTKESLNPFLSAGSPPVCRTSDGAWQNRSHYVLNKIIPTMFLNHCHLPIWSTQYIWQQLQSFSCLLQNDSHLAMWNHMASLANWLPSDHMAYDVTGKMTPIWPYDIWCHWQHDSHLAIWHHMMSLAKWLPFACISYGAPGHVIPVTSVSLYNVTGIPFCSVRPYDIQLKFWQFAHLKMQQWSDRWMFLACLAPLWDYSRKETVPTQ